MPKSTKRSTNIMGNFFELKPDCRVFQETGEMIDALMPVDVMKKKEKRVLVFKI